MVRLFFLGYFICLATGWALLQLPICQQGLVTNLDTFFAAASAVSTTGLQTVDIGKSFSLMGQSVLLLLIQLGGVLYMAFSSWIVSTQGQRIIALPKDSPSLPGHFTLAELFVQIARFTLVCETGGAIALYLFFKNAGVENAAWNGIFHSISAFCTAGFSLFPSNLEGYTNHLGINMVLSLLSILGALGFFLWSDLLKTPSLREKGIRFFARVFSCFTTSVVVTCSFLFILLTTTTESSKFEKLLVSFFHTISAMTTAGFNTVDMRTLPQSALLLLILLMLVGASITGSGMNTKRTALPIIFKEMKNCLSGRETLRLRSQKLLAKRVQIATVTFASYFLVLSIPFWILIIIERQPILSLFFEAVSAVCTTGLSAGITAQLSSLGKGLIILLMLTGRTGILLFGFAISTRKFSRKKAERLT